MLFILLHLICPSQSLHHIPFMCTTFYISPLYCLPLFISDFLQTFFWFFLRFFMVLMSPRLPEYNHRTSHDRYVNRQIFWLDGCKRRCVLLLLARCAWSSGSLRKCAPIIEPQRIREWMYSCESIKSQMLQWHLHANSIEFSPSFCLCGELPDSLQILSGSHACFISTYGTQDRGRSDAG